MKFLKVTIPLCFAFTHKLSSMTTVRLKTRKAKRKQCFSGKLWSTAQRLGHLLKVCIKSKSLLLALAKGAFLFKNLTPLTILLGEYIKLPSISGIVSFLMDGNVSK